MCVFGWKRRVGWGGEYDIPSDSRPAATHFGFERCGCGVERERPLTVVHNTLFIHCDMQYFSVVEQDKRQSFKAG